MFEWYWVFLYTLVVNHIIHACHSIYVHRTIAHRYFVLNKSLDTFFRLVIWLNGRMGPSWAETYASRHRKHHRTSDTINDPHSPHYYTMKQMIAPWEVNWEEAKYYCPTTKTPDDWIQKVLVEKYKKLGPWVVSLVAGILFGWQGLIISAIIEQACGTWLITLIGNWSFHKVGFTYAGNKGDDRSRIMFPLGIYFGGEELHANHHNDQASPNFAHRWFEIDIGYQYARLFEKMGLLEIRNKK